MVHPCKTPFRSHGGFTLLELLVAVAIVGVIFGLLLPAVQRSREAGRRNGCRNNTKQIALGAALYESTHARWPTSGEGKLFAFGVGFGQDRFNSLLGPETVEGVDALNADSFFVQISGFIEEIGIAARWNSKLPYWDSGSANQRLAAKKIGLFLCPSNLMTKDEFGGLNTAAFASADSHKYYGQTDYMPIAFVDVDAAGRRDPPTATSRGSYVEGVTNVLQTNDTRTCGDGTSNTMMFVEDAGRSLQTAGAMVAGASDPSTTVWVATGVGSAAIQCTPQIAGWESDNQDGPSLPGMAAAVGRAAAAHPTCPNRWADPDSGGGVSGPPNEEGVAARERLSSFINNNRVRAPGHRSRFGGSLTFDPSYDQVGPGDCSWHLNNCGSNDEPFSTHATGGVHAGFADGSVHWLSDKTAWEPLRRLLDPNDGGLPSSR